MRCKAGDLALVIGGQPQDVGKMVRCLRLVTPQDQGTLKFAHSTEGVVWKVDRRITWICVETHRHYSRRWIPDNCLLPIHPEGDAIHDAMERAFWRSVRILDEKPTRQR